MDSEGNVWVADSGNNRVEEFSKEGEFECSVGESGHEEGELDNPQGVAIDGAGNVWIIGGEILHNDYRVQEFTKEGSW